MVECCRASSRWETCSPIGLDGSTETGEAAVGACDDLAAQDHTSGLVRTAAGVLSGETSASGKCADERHFARFVFFKPHDARQRLASNPIRLHPQKLRKVCRQRDDPQLLVGCPFIARAACFGLSAAAKDRCKPRPGGRALCPAMKRKRNIIAFGPGLDPKLDV